jgi:hypothetical protein
MTIVYADDQLKLRKLRQMISENPGITKTELWKRSGHCLRVLDKLLASLQADGEIIADKKGQGFYYRVAVPTKKPVAVTV